MVSDAVHLSSLVTSEQKYKIQSITTTKGNCADCCKELKKHRHDRLKCLVAWLVMACLPYAIMHRTRDLIGTKMFRMLEYL